MHHAHFVSKPDPRFALRCPLTRLIVASTVLRKTLMRLSLCFHAFIAPSAQELRNKAMKSEPLGIVPLHAKYVCTYARTIRGLSGKSV